MAIKHHRYIERAQRRYDPFVPSRTLRLCELEPDGPEPEKAHARRGVSKRPDSPERGAAIRMRHSFGYSEKILRRNRKIWTRLYSKRGRALDKQVVLESME